MVNQQENSPIVLLLGSSRSGKTSIANVLFHKMQPNDTLFLDSTSKINKSTVQYMRFTRSFNRFQVWDFPGNLDMHDLNDELDCGAMVFVVDAQV